MDIKLPKLGEGADSGAIVSLSVKVGDWIQKGQTLLELENEKAVAAIPSPVTGRVTQLLVKLGDKVSVGQRLLTMAEAEPAGDVAPAAPPEPSATPVSPPAAPVPVEPPPPEAGAASPGAPPSAAPSIRRLARELGIDLAAVPGRERGGRVVMADLRAYIQRLQRLAAQAPSAPPSPSPARPASEAIDFSQWGPVTTKPLSALRQVIGRRMAESWAVVPRVTQFDEADITDLLALRRECAPAYEQRGTHLTLTGLAVKAVVQTLKKHPLFNSSLDPVAGNLVFKHYYHIGVAVDTDGGLVVPVIRDADHKSLVEISRELEELARKARERKLRAEEMKGGSFTLSNQGGIGGGHFTPIVNLPEVAILGLGRGAVKPVWRDDQVAPRTLLPLTLAYDHRVIDGAQAARWVVDLVAALEHFDAATVRLSAHP